MSRKVREVLGVAVVVAAMLAMTAPTVADDSHSATVEFSSSRIAPVIGGSRGDGTLTLRDGRTYKFSVESITLFSLGVSTMHADGDVYHMNSIKDFEGTYVVVESGVAIGGGASGVVMRNENGVVMRVVAAQMGLNLTVGVGSMSVKVKSHLF